MKVAYLSSPLLKVQSDVGMQPDALKRYILISMNNKLYNLTDVKLLHFMLGRQKVECSS